MEKWGLLRVELLLGILADLTGSSAFDLDSFKFIFLFVCFVGLCDYCLLLAHSQKEAARLPQILSHPSYAASPFETIRLHAQNTLVQRAAPPKRGKKAPKGGAGDGSMSMM